MYWARRTIAILGGLLVLLTLAIVGVALYAEFQLTKKLNQQRIAPAARSRWAKGKVEGEPDQTDPPPSQEEQLNGQATHEEVSTGS
jgi:HAMP domain-containing protein